MKRERKRKLMLVLNMLNIFFFKHLNKLKFPSVNFWAIIKPLRKNIIAISIKGNNNAGIYEKYAGVLIKLFIFIGFYRLQKYQYFVLSHLI